MKITGLLSGPHDDGEEVWCVFNVTDGHNFWTEEIYYEDMEDCLSELNVLRTQGYVEFDEYDDGDNGEGLGW